MGTAWLRRRQGRRDGENGLDVQMALGQIGGYYPITNAIREQDLGALGISPTN
jgi:hypothetical protein